MDYSGGEEKYDDPDDIETEEDELDSEQRNFEPDDEWEDDRDHNPEDD